MKFTLRNFTARLRELCGRVDCMVTQRRKRAESAEMQLLRDIHNHVRDIMATQAQLAADLTAVKQQVSKSKAEILKRIAELEAAVASGGNTSPEVDAALTALKEEVQGVDDLNPDAQP